LAYQSGADIDRARLVVQFWNMASVLVASIDSRIAQNHFRLRRGKGQIRLRVPFLSLTPGIYRLAAGFMVDGRSLSYAGHLVDLQVVQEEFSTYAGLAVLDATFEQAD
jgi:lipopolysaccharide transport system ATP-binding protein